MTSVDIIHQGGAEVGEAPVWNPHTKELHWVDILRGIVYTERLDGEPPSAVTLDTQVGAALPAAAPTELLLCTRAGFVRFDRSTRGQQPLAEPLNGHPELRFNDGKVAPDGRAFGGTMPYQADTHPGALYRLDGAARATTVVAPLRLANGLAWAPDGRTMYVIDSGARVLFRACYDLDTGAVSQLHPHITFDVGEHAMPDGMCVDADGCLWVAIMGAGRIERYTPAGVLDRSVELPLRRPTSLCFAGPQLDTLIVTSLSYRLSAAQHREDPLAGSLLALDGCGSGLAATPWNPELIGEPARMSEQHS